MIAEFWSEYERRMVNVDCGAVHRAEIRHAFFDGAAMLYDIMTGLSVSGLSAETAIGVMAQINTELAELTVYHRDLPAREKPPSQGP